MPGSAGIDTAPPVPRLREWHAEAQRYRPDIDGLRAVAVGAVIAYHAFPAAVPGGFVGVDVFFVISGYLISGIIFASLAQHRLNAADFYGRRVRRIFPALLIVLGACLVYGAVVLLPVELSQLGKNTAAGAGFLSNVVLWRESGYFDHAAATKSLLHLWSLGVEEQFYLIWPLALWAFCRMRATALGIVALAIVSFAGNLLWAARDASADFYLPMTRLWEFAPGALLAWHAGRTRQQSALPAAWSNTAAAIGLLAIASGLVLFDQTQPYPGWRALLPVTGAASLIAAGPAAAINRRVLCNRLAVGAGLISYPLYLWHWPLISFATIIRRGRPPTFLMGVALVSISVVLAWLTYRFVEIPFRFRGHRRIKTMVLCGSMGAAAIAGLAVWQAEGVPARERGAATLDIARINAAVEDGVFQPTRDMHVTAIGRLALARIGDFPGAVLFMGDSVVYQYGPRVQRLLDEGRLRKTVYFLVGPSCAPFRGITRRGPIGQCGAMLPAARDLLAKEPVDTVILGEFWAGNAGPDTFVDRAGQRMALVTDQAKDAVYANLRDFVRSLSSPTRRVYLILAAPSDPRFDPRRMIRPVDHRVSHRSGGEDRRADRRAGARRGGDRCQIVANRRPHRRGNDRSVSGRVRRDAALRAVFRAGRAEIRRRQAFAAGFRAGRDHNVRRHPYGRGAAASGRPCRDRGWRPTFRALG